MTINKMTAQERAHLLGNQDFKQPWPRWAKRCAARLLTLLFPITSTQEWLACFESEDAFTALGSKFEDGWFCGRLPRCIAELKQSNPETLGQLSESKWVRNMTLEEGKLKVEYGQGLEGMVLHRMQQILQEPAEVQREFWRSFAKGFDSEFCPRKIDGKAIQIYVWLLLTWPTAQNCVSINDLYDFVFQYVAKEPCPPEIDPVDFEERHHKWFEKLCQRNLGITLAKRGRPARAGKIPQSI
jgi:hypothetical protein